MPYPGNFHRLVAIGSLYTEEFNWSLSIVPTALGETGMLEVNDTTLEACATAIGSWWSSHVDDDGPGVTGQAKLTSIKLNRIGPDGRYVDPETHEYVYPSPVAGNSVASNQPAQVATAITLRTRIPRGRGSHGRFYLPPNAASTGIGTDGRASVAAAGALALSVASLVDQLNSIYALVGRVGVASNAGAGRFEHVERIDVGRVPDTIRSRRASLPEDYQSAPIA